MRKVRHKNFHSSNFLSLVPTSLIYFLSIYTMEIYEVSTPADRSIELIKWLNTKGINDRICNTLQDASHRQAFTTVISTVLDEGQQILKQATDEGKYHSIHENIETGCKRRG